MEIIPIATSRLDFHDTPPMLEWILQHCSFKDGDMLVITSKVVSYFEGRVASLNTVQVLSRAKRYANTINAKPELLQLALDEADAVIAETPWVLLTRKNGIFCANAGVDTSNVPPGYAVLWPKDPFRTAQKIHSQLKKHLRLRRLAIIMTDSMCIPGRKGTIAVAIGYAGFKGIQDLKGSKDLFGNVLRYSALNIVDSLATAANVVMGEGRESTPLAIIRGYEWSRSRTTSKIEMTIPPEDEMFPLS